MSSLPFRPMSFRVSSYVDPLENEAFHNSDPCRAPYDLEGGNPFTQGYTHLKSLAEFAGAADC